MQHTADTKEGILMSKHLSPMLTVWGLPTPNELMEGRGFHVSYNDRDTGPDMYGCVTTALVLGQMQQFLTLNGDHRAAYQPLIAQGVDACLAYFAANLDQMNLRSEGLPARPDLLAIARQPA